MNSKVATGISIAIGIGIYMVIKHFREEQEREQMEEMSSKMEEMAKDLVGGLNEEIIRRNKNGC